MTYWILEAYLPSWWAVSWKLTYHGDRGGSWQWYASWLLGFGSAVVVA